MVLEVFRHHLVFLATSAGRIGLGVFCKSFASN